MTTVTLHTNSSSRSSRNDLEAIRRHNISVAVTDHGPFSYHNTHSSSSPWTGSGFPVNPFLSVLVNLLPDSGFSSVPLFNPIFWTGDHHTFVNCYDYFLTSLSLIPKVLTNLVSWNISPPFPCNRFRVLGLTLKSLSHFGLVFIQESSFISSACFCLNSTSTLLLRSTHDCVWPYFLSLPCSIVVHHRDAPAFSTLCSVDI